MTGQNLYSYRSHSEAKKCLLSFAIVISLTQKKTLEIINEKFIEKIIEGIFTGHLALRSGIGLETL